MVKKSHGNLRLKCTLVYLTGMVMDLLPWILSTETSPRYLYDRLTNLLVIVAAEIALCSHRYDILSMDTLKNALQ